MRYYFRAYEFNNRLNAYIDTVLSVRERKAAEWVAAHWNDDKRPPQWWRMVDRFHDHLDALYNAFPADLWAMLDNEYRPLRGKLNRDTLKYRWDYGSDRTGQARNIMRASKMLAQYLKEDYIDEKPQPSLAGQLVEMLVISQICRHETTGRLDWESVGDWAPVDVKSWNA